VAALKASEKHKGESRSWPLALGYLVFCLVSLASRFVYPIFGLAAMGGIALPLVWGLRTGEWSATGFSRRKWGTALLWGDRCGRGTICHPLSISPRSG
jgi:hypothetical protein